MKKILPDEISAEILAAIAGLKDAPEAQERGVLMKVSDGIAWIWGLKSCGFNELVALEAVDGGPDVLAFALNLEEDQIGAVLLGDERRVVAGGKAAVTGRIFEVPVGPALLGRVVDPLGNPLDGLGPIEALATSPIEKVAPGVIKRQGVKQSLPTGIKAIDALIPIGLGQRELIIGDRQTGKTAIALDTIINQSRRHTGVISIYVAIGQKTSKLKQIVEKLKSEGALSNTIVVATSASDSAALQYVAPYAGCAMGEYFRDKGEDALIVYDDLSRHAWAYRQMSLLLRRPPGREAYPGDVFYLHSRLLERAAKLSDELGAGSLTALPIIETQGSDVSAYIPTNVISITDGQIYLESSLFYQGIRPAVNVGLSVSRVGGAAQTPAMKAVASRLRLDLAQYRDLAAFAQLATDLDADTKSRIERGRRVTELLKQPQWQPQSLAEEVLILLAGTQGLFDQVPVENVSATEKQLWTQIASRHPDVCTGINKTGKLGDEDKEKVLAAMKAIVTNSKVTTS